MAAYLCLTSFQVKAILVNIFGGIVNCASIANGIIGACNKMKLSIPLVVRLEGKLSIPLVVRCQPLTVSDSYSLVLS